jgi:FkbM family methyltransferase
MAVLFFKALYPGADVLAFEPDAGAFARLSQTIASNALKGVVAEQAAVTERGGTVAFYRDPGDPAGIAASVDPAWGGSASDVVRAVRLSERITAPVDFLKLDIEGAEYGVVRDLVSSGAIEHVREAVIEYHEVASEPGGLHELMASLAGAGFTVAQTASPGALPVGLVRARRAGSLTPRPRSERRPTAR